MPINWKPRALLWWFKNRPELMWWAWIIGVAWWVLIALAVTLLGYHYKVETGEPAFISLIMAGICYFWTYYWGKYIDNKLERMRLEAFYETTLERRFGRFGRGTAGETSKKEE